MLRIHGEIELRISVSLLGAGMAALALAGCNIASEEDQANSTDVEQPLAWRDAPGESKFFTEDDYAVRCWSVEKRYDCLHLEVLDRKGVVGLGTIDFSAVRKSYDELPTSFFTPDGQPYSCGQLFGQAEERVESSNGDTLVKNEIFTSEGEFNFWPRSFVEDFFKDNGIDPSDAYFDCGALTQILERGSLATLGTTLIDYSLLQPEQTVSRQSETPAMATSRLGPIRGTDWDQLGIGCSCVFNLSGERGSPRLVFGGEDRMLIRPDGDLKVCRIPDSSVQAAFDGAVNLSCGGIRLSLAQGSSYQDGFDGFSNSGSLGIEQSGQTRTISGEMGCGC